MKTFVNLSESSAADTTPKLINVFKNGRFTHDIRSFFPEKMNNLQKFTIQVATVKSMPYVFAKQTKKRDYHLHGKDISFIETVAKQLNFKIDSQAHFYQNGTIDGAFQTLFEGKADLVLTSLGMREKLLNFFDASDAYNSEKLVLIIPPGAKFTSFEKLAYLFSLMVWILISIGFFLVLSSFL